MLSGILVFFMQAGFTLVESGFTRSKNAVNISMKNILDISVGTLSFWALGYGLMYGDTNGYIATSGLLFNPGDGAHDVFFQTVFCATAATIVSGAIAGRTKYTTYVIFTIFLTAIIYPISGSWQWNGGGFLANMGFIDFAGSSIVHSVGGWIALAAIIILGPRIGKYSNANKGKFTGSSFPLAVLGTLILWFGWFGFNGGSNGAMDETVPLILINTFLAAAFGLLTGLGISYLRFKKPEPFYIILGPLAGLVAITAGCNSMTSVTSIFVGIVGAIIAIIVNEVLNKYEIDDVVGAVPVHLAAGVWGTLAVGLFSDLTILDTGLDRFAQIKIQLIGIIVIGLFSFMSSFIILSLFNKFYPLRVSPMQEELGLNIAEHNAVSIEHDLISILDKQSESGDLKIRGPQDPFTAGGVIGLYYNKLMSKLETSEEEKNKWRAISRLG